MRFCWLFALGLLAVSAPAFAQTLPPVMLGGEMAKAGSKDCFIHPGYSTFQRNVLTAPAAGSKAVLTFATAICQGADLSGQAALTFDSATSGNIRFKRFPASVAGSTGLTFTNYSETYNAAARELVVKFDITGVFPVTLVIDAP